MAKFVDCFMLMGTALSLRPEMGRPLLQDVGTTRVNLSLMIQEFKIFESKYLLGGLLTQRWIDPRLGANIRTRKMAINGQIWKPKIVNVIGERRKSVEDSAFWRGFEENVVLSEKISVRSLCTWDYHKFPFDTQMCDVKFGSFRFPADEVELIWDLTAVQVTANLDFNDFEIKNIETSVEIDIRSEGNFSVAVTQFVLKRQSKHHIFCVFLPLCLLSLLNYLSFWMSKQFRRFFNVIVLICVLISYRMSCFTHPTPYLKASDIFILICGCFSLIILTETFFMDIITTLDDFHYPKKNSKWVLKLSYPIFYIFVMALYAFWYL
ncbi:serotonin-gated chloride channel mod-1-like isoform X2 [Tribolium castaneum]|uniref:serotonin-gated chloride channel mod-1-like isoform X2 n=1 Tax=Tribolium castaneum TaxID=7070 RepID=UPI0030FEF78E